MMRWNSTDIVKGTLHWWALFSLWKHIYNDFCGSDINIDHFRILIFILFKTVLQTIWKTPFTCIMGNVAPSVFGVERDWMCYSAAVILSILSLIRHFWVPQHYGSAIFICCSTLRMETPQIYLEKRFLLLWNTGQFRAADLWKSDICNLWQEVTSRHFRFKGVTSLKS